MAAIRSSSRASLCARPSPWLFAALLCTGLVTAQQSASAGQPAREPVRGSVVTADGKPWAGATVTLLSRPLPDDERFGEADTMQATSDAGGRFQAALLTGRRYIAWATAELPDNQYLVSHAAENVCAGRPLELVADAPRPHATVQIEGLDPWRPHGAITCTLLSNTPVRILVPCPEQAGQLVLPAFPGRRAALEIRCGERVLKPWADAIDLTMAKRQALRVQPPRAVRFRCVDATKQPIADVAFLACDIHGRHATEIAHSDASGMLVAQLPLSATPFNWANYPMLLEGAGRTPRYWIGTLKIPVDHDGTKSPPLMDFVMNEGRHLKSRLTFEGAAVTEGKLRVVSGMTTADREGGSYDVTRCLPLGRNGGFAVDVDPEHAAVLTAFLPTDLLARLQPARGFPLHPELLLAALSPGDKTSTLPEQLELQQLIALDVQVLGPEGAPADQAMVGIAAALPDLHRAIVATTDRSGRVRLLLPRDQKLVLSCWSEQGVGHAEVATGAVKDVLRPQLEACERLHGKVIDGKGKPVAWAEVAFFVGNDSMEPAAALARCLAHRLRVRSDAEGRFDLPLYPGLRYSLSVVATPDDDHYPKVPDFTVGSNTPDQLTIDLSVTR